MYVCMYDMPLLLKIQEEGGAVRNALSSAASTELLANGVGGGEKITNITRSLSIAADILRKEPEQETFVRIDMTPIGTYIN